MTLKDIDIEMTVKEIHLVLNINLKELSSIDIDYIIDAEVYKFFEDRDVIQNRRIIEDIYKANIYDKIFEMDLEHQLPINGKDGIIALIAADLIATDIKENFKEIVMSKILKKLLGILLKD